MPIGREKSVYFLSDTIFYVTKENEMETHEATDWLLQRIAWERWLTELHQQAEVEVESLVQRRQRRLPAVLTSDWWNRRSA